MSPNPLILPWPPGRRGGFTLIEILVSITLISAVMLMLLQLTSVTQRLWLDGRAKASQFREARAAFESMTRQLSQATLNTFWDYDDPLLPTKYVRQSDLHFVAGSSSRMLAAGVPTPTQSVFFQAPIGLVDQPADERLNDLLNCWGYYVRFGSDLDDRPAFLADGTRVAERVRYRLMEFRQPSEDFPVFALNLRTAAKPSMDFCYRWFSGKPDSTLLTRASHPLAENIVALVISPRVPLPAKGGHPDPAEYERIAPNYNYDTREFQWAPEPSDRIALTRNQLPPTLLVTMVAIDEVSAQRLRDRGQAADLIDDDWFTKVSDYASDMNALTERLLARHVNYRVFTGTVYLRNSKWSD